MDEPLRTTALILRHYPVGENHRNLVFLTREGEVFSATAYGARGRKSSLRPLIFPFHEVALVSRYDRVKDRHQVKEMISRRPFEGVRTEVERYYTASLWAEAVIKSRREGVGAAPGLADLFLGDLAVLADTPPAEVFTPSAHFLWHYLEEEGVQPSLTECGQCGRSPAEGESLLWQDSAELLICQTCPSPAVPQGRLTPGARRFLQTLAAHPPGDAGILRFSLDALSFQGLRRALYHMLQAHLEGPLKTLRSGVI